MRDARTLAASHANKESAHGKLNPHVDWPEKLHVKVLPLDTSSRSFRTVARLRSHRYGEGWLPGRAQEWPARIRVGQVRPWPPPEVAQAAAVCQGGLERATCALAFSAPPSQLQEPCTSPQLILYQAGQHMYVLCCSLAATNTRDRKCVSLDPLANFLNGR